MGKNTAIPIRQTHVEQKNKSNIEEISEVEICFTPLGSDYKLVNTVLKIKIIPTNFIRKIGFSQPQINVNRTAEKINIPICCQPATTSDSMLPLLSNGKLVLSNGTELPLTSKGYLMIIKPGPRPEPTETIELKIEKIVELEHVLLPLRKSRLTNDECFVIEYDDETATGESGGGRKKKV